MDKPAVVRLGLCLVLTAYSLVLTDVAHAAVPHLIRYQGQAVDSNGVPLEGPYTLTFRLYNAETAGTAVWQEAQPNVILAGGHFSILLGQVQTLDAMDWTQPRWLSVQVNTDPELAPRQRITSVPLALVAERLADANTIVPARAMMAFNLAACPVGWSSFAAANGRVIVGGATGVTRGDPLSNGGPRLLTQVPDHFHIMRILDTNPHQQNATAVGAQDLFAGIQTSGYLDPPGPRGIQTGRAGTPGGVDVSMPYLQLLYCQKD